MEEVFRFADDLGPSKIIHVHEPRLGLRAVLVVDNAAPDPSIGGLRMAPDVSTAECFHLARAIGVVSPRPGHRYAVGDLRGAISVRIPIDPRP